MEALILIILFALIVALGYGLYLSRRITHLSAQNGAGFIQTDINFQSVAEEFDSIIGRINSIENQHDGRSTHDEALADNYNRKRDALNPATGKVRNVG